MQRSKMTMKEISTFESTSEMLFYTVLLPKDTNNIDLLPLSLM